MSGLTSINEKDERWNISLSRNEFESFRNNPQFATLLTLARVVNALQFCFHALLESSEGNRPAHTRQRMNSVLFSAGILHEGFDVAQRLGQHFREFDAYQRGFRKLLADPVTQKLRSTVLRSMRNDIAFHFNPLVAPTVLKDLKLDRYYFVVSIGPKEGDTYYQLADEVAFNYLIGEQASQEDEIKALTEILDDFTHVISGFLHSANELLAEALIDMGWKAHFEPNQEDS